MFTVFSHPRQSTTPRRHPGPPTPRLQVGPGLSRPHSPGDSSVVSSRVCVDTSSFRPLDRTRGRNLRRMTRGTFSSPDGPFTSRRPYHVPPLTKWIVRRDTYTMDWGEEMERNRSPIYNNKGKKSVPSFGLSKSMGSGSRVTLETLKSLLDRPGVPRPFGYIHLHCK